MSDSSSALTAGKDGPAEDAVVAIDGDLDFASGRYPAQAGDGPMRVPDGRLSVLLIEDEVLISLDMCDTIVQAGYEVIGPATTMTGAMFLLRQRTPQLAIVDVVLRDGPCTELANQLRACGVPFFVHSGYGRHAREIEGFSAERWLPKPASPDEVVGMLDELAKHVRAPSAETGKPDALAGKGVPLIPPDAATKRLSATKGSHSDGGQRQD